MISTSLLSMNVYIYVWNCWMYSRMLIY